MDREIAGTHIHYELAGAGEKRVVLLHGWGCDLTLMAPVAAALASDMRVMSVDFPAHGKSGRPPEPWGVADFAHALKELLEAEGFLPCAVVAHSFGCRVTIQLAAENPAMFTRIVMTGAAGIKSEPTEEAKKRSAEYQRLKKIFGAMKKARVFGSLPDKAAEKLRQKYGSADYNALDDELRKTFVKVVGQDLSPELPAIKQPTLLLWGTEDTATPLWMGEKMAETIPDAALVKLEGGDHFAYLQQITRFNLITRCFLLEA